MYRIGVVCIFEHMIVVGGLERGEGEGEGKGRGVIGVAGRLCWAKEGG